MHKTPFMTIVVLLVAASGCSKATSPADVVAEFLEAVRSGHSEAASDKLTPLALQRIKENDMDFAPPASETAQFRVGKVEMFAEDKAFVDSVWIERDGDGKPYEENMTWGLKLTGAGWRISGMAAHMGPNQPPILVDFENPGQLPGAQNAPSANQQNEVPRQAMQPAQNPFHQSTPR